MGSVRVEFRPDLARKGLGEMDSHPLPGWGRGSLGRWRVLLVGQGCGESREDHRKQDKKGETEREGQRKSE